MQEAATLSHALRFMARVAKRLQVRQIPDRPAQFDRYDVVDQHGDHDPALALTHPAQRRGSERAGAKPSPLGRVIELVGRVLPRGSLIVLLLARFRQVDITQARLRHQGSAARSAANGLTGPWHRRFGAGSDVRDRLSGLEACASLQCLARDDWSAVQPKAPLNCRGSGFPAVAPACHSARRTRSRRRSNCGTRLYATPRHVDQIQSFPIWYESERGAVFPARYEPEAG